MYTYIHLESGIGPEPSVLSALAVLGAVVDGIRGRVEAEDGGLSKPVVAAAVAERLASKGFRVPTEGDLRASAATRQGPGWVPIDALHPASGLGVTVHAGRAWTNNEALLGVLKMAAADEVRTAAVVVPARYKGSAAAEKISEFLITMSQWSGVRLELNGIAVLAY